MIVAISGCQQRRATVDLPPCMYLRASDGRGYSLGYAGQTCANPTHPALPQAQYGAAADAAYGSPRRLSTLDAFRIYARLATLDTRGEMVFTMHSGFSSAYEWGHHLELAQAVVNGGLMNPSLLDRLVEEPLAEGGFAHGHGGLFRAAWHWKGLDNRQRRTLVQTLAGIELQLGRIAQLTASRDSTAYIGPDKPASGRSEHRPSAAYAIELQAP
jgi:hypothetical protein